MSCKFTIEKILEKKKNANSVNCNFCIATIFNFPYEINLEPNEPIDVYFDKVIDSHNFYIALDQPILPQVCGNYSIIWKKDTIALW